jgi:hypothetical protein
MAARRVALPPETAHTSANTQHTLSEHVPGFHALLSARRYKARISGRAGRSNGLPTFPLPDRNQLMAVPILECGS